MGLDQVEIKGLLPSDVTNAQFDLRHLSLEQLLRIRINAIDFWSESESHNAHVNFLNSVDQHLYEKLARRLASADQQQHPIGKDASQGNPKPAAWRELGRWALLITGAADCIVNQGWASGSAAGSALLPDEWVIALDVESWSARAALFSTRSLELRFLFGERPDYAAHANGASLAVVLERTISAQRARERPFGWEIRSLDPHVDDIHKEILRASSEKASRQRTSTELSAVISRRCTADKSWMGQSLGARSGVSQ